MYITLATSSLEY